MVDSDEASSGTQLLLQRLDEIQQNVARIECLYDNTSTTMALDEGRETISLWKDEGSEFHLYAPDTLSGQGPSICRN